MKKITRKLTAMLIALALFALNNVNAQSWTTYTTVDGLANNTVLSVAIDPSGNKWFGQGGGKVSKFDGTTWTTYTLANMGKNGDVKTIGFDLSGNKWFCNDGGVSKFNGTTWTDYTTTDGLANNTVQSLSIDLTGNVWCATEGGGVSKFNGTTWTTYTTTNGLASNYVYSSAVDSSGNMWFGTLAGVSTFDGATWTTYTITDGLATNMVHTITIDPAGNKWFGTDGGVSKLSGTTWTTYKTTDGLVDNTVYAIAIDSSGNKWFGTNGGISKFDGINWKTFTTTDGLVSNNVYSIDIDKAGNIWIGTFAGVSRFDENAAPTAVTGVTLDKSTLEIKESQSSSLTVTVAPANATNKNVSWTTSDATVATVVNGLVTGVKVGTAKIIVTSADGGFKDTCNVSITPIIAGITLNKNILNIDKSATSTLTVTLAPAGVTCYVYWLSNDITVATVANGVVTGVNEGTARIIVTAQEDKNHSFSDTCYVTVGKLAAGSSNLQGLYVFPNPATELINVTTPSYPAILNIMDMSGQIIKQVNTTSAETAIDISSFVSGYYLISIQSESGRVISKLIKE